MPTIFSETLTRLRKEAGFPTAYKFYHTNGGAPMLKLSYRKYLAMEQGTILPVFNRLPKLLLGLSAMPATPRGSALIKAWLETMAGKDTFNYLLEPLLARNIRQEPPSGMCEVTKKFLAEKQYTISISQLAAITETLNNYMCFLALSNDTGIWSAKELSPILSLKEREIEVSLRSLAALKIVKQVKPGRYKCPHATRMLVYPDMHLAAPGTLDKIKKYQGELLSHGKVVWRSIGILRADADALCGFFPILQSNIATSHAYAVTKKTNRSAMFAVEGRVVKLGDF